MDKLGLPRDKQTKTTMLPLGNCSTPIFTIMKPCVGDPLQITTHNNTQTKTSKAPKKMNFLSGNEREKMKKDVPKSPSLPALLCTQEQK